tara:strand:+ start:412 stop:687 length:276 start_codon:yes stop_codon:yes gene_type:complete
MKFWPKREPKEDVMLDKPYLKSRISNTFKRSAKMKEAELKMGGEDLEEFLPRLYEEVGLKQAAEKLGVSKATLWYWLLRLGFRIERRLVRY